MLLSALAACRGVPTLALAVLASAVLALALAAPASAAACPGADAHPGVAARATIERATLCLLNRERRQEGLGALRHNDFLALAAERHARDMVARGYFSHDSPSGTSFVQRIVRTGYTHESSWTLGENLAWGSGNLATPAEIMDAWMASPGHKANVLGPFREVGIGSTPGAPERGHDAGETYVTEFGIRR